MHQASFFNGQDQETIARETIATMIKRLRKAKQVKQKDVAQAVGIGNSTLSNYEAGEREIPQATLKKLIDYYVNAPTQSDAQDDQTLLALQVVVSGIESRLDLLSIDRARASALEQLKSDIYVIKALLNAD